MNKSPKMMAVSLFIIFSFFFQGRKAHGMIFAHKGPLFSLEDLRILAKQRQSHEFLVHARDIRPAQRTEEWKKLSLEMALLWASKALKALTPDRAHLLALEELSTWDSLSADPSLMAEREKLGLRYFSYCSKLQALRKQCQEDARRFWSNTNEGPTKTDLALALWELFPDAPESRRAWPRHALKSEMAELYCKREKVQSYAFLELNKTLTQYISRNKGKWKKKPLAHTLLQITGLGCWKSMKGLLRKGLEQRALAAHRSSFLALWSLELLEESDEAFYSVLYLLRGPTVGDLFNRSWSKTKMLSENFTMRQKVFKRLSSLDPLPGQIFSSPSKLRSHAIIRLVANSFPEYLEFYLGQCQMFYSGKKTFAKGNPTLECFELSKRLMTSIKKGRSSKMKELSKTNLQYKKGRKAKHL